VVVLRLVSGILAVTFLPLGLVFVVLGLAVEDVDRGEPEAFVYLGVPLLVAGLGFALAFAVLQRRENQRRRRRREGLSATAEVVRAQLKMNIRSSSTVGLNLTVRFSAAGTADGTVTRMLMVDPMDRPVEGTQIEIRYDPSDPSNFELV